MSRALRCGPAEALELVRSQGGAEELAWSPAPVLVIDPTTGPPLPEASLERLVSDLGALRAVTVAVLTTEATGPVAATAARCDIVVATADAGAASAVGAVDPDEVVAGIAAATEANPEAAVAMVQLLRLRCYDDVANGLVAESLTYSMLQAGEEFRRWLDARGPAHLPADPEPPVSMTRVDSRLEIVLNRPHRANAVTASLRDHLVEALELADVDPTIDAVVLSGAGASFCSGGDLAEFGSTPSPGTGHRIRTTRSPAWAIHRLAGRSRAMIHGTCIGAGIEMPAFAGGVWAHPDTRIRLPEVAMGLVPGAGGTVSIPRRIGPWRTNWLAITGAEIGADEARAWGLVDRVVASP